MSAFKLSRLGKVGAVLLVSALGPLMGCARGPDVQSGLALRRVVIYRNGVGYYERAGHVDEEEVSFKVRTERIGDFLATLAVMEQGGSSVRSASFPVDLEKNKDGADEDDEESEEGDEAEVAQPQSIPIGMPRPQPPPKKKAKKKKDNRETVRLGLDGNEHDLVVGYVAETPVWRPSYRLVVSKKGSSEPTADLQAWGIVQNQSGEDWKGVRLSLVAGAPLAFQATLDKPVVPPRPTVTDQGEVIGSVPLGETSLPSAPPPPPAPPPEPAEAYAGDEGGETLDELLAEREEAAPMDQDAPAPRSAPGAGVPSRGPMKKGEAAATRGRVAGNYQPGYGSGAAGGVVGGYPRPEMPKPVVPSGPRNMSALAGVAMEGGTTRYDLPFPVDIPDKSATMVLLTAQRVPGEAIFLFAPDGGVPDSASHPFRVARFTNTTKGLLEKGPIAVFDDGAFLGQGMVDPLPPGAIATVPFALERSLAVTIDRKEDELSARLGRIESGQIFIERDWVYRTKYTVKNGSDLDARTLVKHGRIPGTRLHEPPKGSEDNVGTGSALVPVSIPKRNTGVLDVEERRSFSRAVDPLSQLADDAVRAYMNDARADKVVVAELKKAWEARNKLRGALDERNKLQAEQTNLERESDQLRRNLKSIEKIKDDPRDPASRQSTEKMRQDFTERLGKASVRLGEITKRLTILDIEINEQSVRLRDLLAGIKVDKPLATL
ncbi:DUF4139 domain-containing protein [Polyangium aurulentum]|uniref:DUF4139 domain-containing protein n=1 Tax=Polyangium aurulentum TaxID=2567896 RepID=UPI0010AE4461|nr:DUF4139 domain-containing protein [Polyangium aurulentum]UQA56590.1 DUF4139 domain-containing protein [Polyangium aurulentum]